MLPSTHNKFCLNKLSNSEFEIEEICEDTEVSVNNTRAPILTQIIDENDNYYEHI